MKGTGAEDRDYLQGTGVKSRMLPGGPDVGHRCDRCVDRQVWVKDVTWGHRCVQHDSLGVVCGFRFTHYLEINYMKKTGKITNMW